MNNIKKLQLIKLVFIASVIEVLAGMVGTLMTDKKKKSKSLIQ